MDASPAGSKRKREDSDNAHDYGQSPKRSALIRSTASRPLGGEWSKSRLRQMVQGEGVDGPPDWNTKYIAIDCEMVGVMPTGRSSLARVSIVDYEGRTMLDQFVKQTKEVVNYRTKWSGVRPRDLENAPTFEEVQRQVSRIMKNRIVVGHALQNDFRVLHITYPPQFTRDTQRYKPLLQLGVGKALKLMIKDVLGIDIQAHEHDSVIDARASLGLFRLYQREWEERLPPSHFIDSSEPMAQAVETRTADATPPMLGEKDADTGAVDALSPENVAEEEGRTQDARNDDNALKHEGILAGLSIHIIPAKLSSDAVMELHRLAESNGATISSQPNIADVILTAVGARKRLERHIDLNAARKGPALRIEWLQRSIEAGKPLPFEEFMAMAGLASGENG